MSSLSIPLFVYGTLKKGYHAHNLIKGSKFLGFGYTTRDYKLLKCGSFPGLSKTKNGTVNIEGELYELNKNRLPSLHNYEGVGSGLFDFEILSLESIELVSEPDHRFTNLMFHRKLCFGYIFNNQHNFSYEEIDIFTID